MNAIRFLTVLAFATLLSGTMSGEESSSVEVLVVARKAEWVQAEAWYFDITIKNATDTRVNVPYIYDGLIEIDGKLYTQFPKPKIVGAEPDRTIEPGETTNHGTLTINGKGFDTVDAKTGKVPLKLAAGEHSLKLSLGQHESKKILFKLLD